MATSADVSTPAARASALSAPRPAAPEEPAGNPDDESERPRYRPLRTAAISLALLVLLGGVVFGGWSYTQRQYYVGATEDGHVAVFKGIQGEIAGMDLSSSTPSDGERGPDAGPQETGEQAYRIGMPGASRRLSELTSETRPTRTSSRSARPRGAVVDASFRPSGSGAAHTGHLAARATDRSPP